MAMRGNDVMDPTSTDGKARDQLRAPLGAIRRKNTEASEARALMLAD